MLDVFSDLFIYIFDNLQSRFAKELEAINKQHPFEPLQVRLVPYLDSQKRGHCVGDLTRFVRPWVACLCLPCLYSVVWCGVA